MECPHCPYEAEVFCAVGLDAAIGMEARREAATVVNCIVAMTERRSWLLNVSFWRMCFHLSKSSR